MEEVIYVGLIPITNFLQQFSPLVAACGFSEKAYVLVEQLPTHVIRQQERQQLIRFEHFQTTATGTLAHYTTGRIFDKQAELRWEQQGDQIQVVYLGAAQRIQNVSIYGIHEPKEPFTLPSPNEKKYYLFGKRLDKEDRAKIGPAAEEGDFAEVRIPRLLRYPVDPKGEQYAYLVVQEYRNEENVVVLFRFQDVKLGVKK